MMLISYFTVGIGCIFTIFVLGIMLLQNYVIKKSIKNYFFSANVLTILMIISEIGTSYFELSNIPFNWLYVTFNVIGFSLSPFISIFLSFIFIPFNPNRKYNVLLIPLMVNLILTILSPIFGFVFQISGTDFYARGSLFVVYMIAYLCSVVYLLLSINMTIKENQGDGSFVLIMLFLFIFSGTTVQIIVPYIHTTWLFVTFSLVIVYAYFCELSEKEDILTNLFNRRAYDYKLKHLKKEENVFVLFLDVDDFKFVNDTYGHLKGDFYLKTIAQMIKESFGSIGKCFRIGGDEFCVMIKTERETTIQYAIHTCYQKISHYQKNDDKLPSVSIGYSLYNQKSGRIEQTIKRAEKQMYACKEDRKTH